MEDQDDKNNEEGYANAPFLGMTFETYDDAYDLYNSYARTMGFSVRKQRLDKNKSNGIITRREFCCSREGCYSKKVTPKKKRDSSRCGCNAMIEVKILNSKQIVVSKFVQEHNHDLVSSSSSHLLRSQREIYPSQKELITTMHASGFSQSQIYSYFSTQAGGARNLNFIQTDCNNFVQQKRVDFLKKGDVTCLNEYFRGKKREDKLFFHAFRTNMENEVTGFFFCDAKCRRDYAIFGDALCFDTTFNTNKYNLLCAPIIGVNNHGQTIFFGCGMIDGESESGCVWLFETFLEAMGGKKPISIFTDQAAGIISAIEKVFPESHHMLCLWHIYQNAAKHLSHVYGDSKKFSKDLKSCIYEPETIEEFESSWNSLLENYDGLKDNRWIQGIYELREKWAQVFARSYFCAGMTTTQRSESINKLLKSYFGRSLTLREFVTQYDKVIISRREKERLAETMSKQTNPNLISSWKVEFEASKKYSRKIFNSFQAELGKLVDLRLDFESTDEISQRYKVLNFANRQIRSVIYIPSNQSVSCSCRMFEFQGILCSHSLKVLRELNLETLPPQYYLKRWSIDVSNEIVLDLYGEVLVCDHDPIYLVRYNELSHLSQQIVAKSSRDEHLYEFVKSGFIDMNNKLKCLTINEEVNDDAIIEENPRDPKIIMSKGGGKRRKKNALEIKAPKKKTISKTREGNPNAHIGGSSSHVYPTTRGPIEQQYGIQVGHDVCDYGNQNGYQVMSHIDYRPFMHSQVFQGPVRQLNFIDESTSRASGFI